MNRSWRDSVLDALRRQSALSQDGIVTRKQLIEYELNTIVTQTQTKGDTPDQTLSYELQCLRNAGLVEFLKQGKYRLVRPVVDVETFAGTQDELDTAIAESRLRIGRIETGDDLALQNRRRGQQRLRYLSLKNYGNMCALCDVRDTELLVASHIARWADSEDSRGELANVVILCKPHDSLFEYGYWSLSDDLKIIRSANKPTSATVQNLLKESISFRRPSVHQPRPEYLQLHRQRHTFSN